MVSSAESPRTDDAAATAALAVYGQKSQPEETAEFLSTSQATLTKELDKLPDDKKAGWLKAQEKCPNLVGEEHRLMFLRCEVFNAELAALRIGKYWSRRVELFGENRAFKPLHLGEDGALSSTNSSSGSSEHDADDEAMVKFTVKGLNIGFMRPTQTHDNGGRAILFVDPSTFAAYNKNNIGEREGLARAVWYVVHSMIEGNDMVQKLGMVVIAFPHHAKLSMIDRKLMKMNMESLSGCIPVRMGGFHICHPPWFFGKIVFPIMKVIMPERMRKRVRMHSGSEENVLENLKEFGLGKEVLPSEIGGDVILDTNAWMKEMKAKGL